MMGWGHIFSQKCGFSFLENLNYIHLTTPTTESDGNGMKLNMRDVTLSRIRSQLHVKE